MIGRASTNVEFIPMNEVDPGASFAAAGHAGEAGEGFASDESDEAYESEGVDEEEEQTGRWRGTEVMPAVQIADVLGTFPSTDEDDDGAEPSGRRREIRTTTVMSSVEVADVLQSNSAPELPKDDAGKKGRKRRGPGVAERGRGSGTGLWASRAKPRKLRTWRKRPRKRPRSSSRWTTTRPRGSTRTWC